MTSRERKARIPVANGKEISISEDQWRRIEQVYGYGLPPAVRDYIVLATEALRLVGTAELKAPSLKTMTEKTEDLKSAAQSLLESFDGLDLLEVPVKEGGALSSLEAIADTVATAIKECPNDQVQFLMLVFSLSAACTLMLRAWEADPGLHEGWMWDTWVQSISEAMAQYGLPTAVRKDTNLRVDREEKNSGFYNFISELQKHIPEELRRHKTPDALAAAIHRARKSNWLPMLLPLKVREMFAAYLESPEERAKRYASFEQGLRSAGYVEVTPGRFESAEMVELMKRFELMKRVGRDERKGEPKSQDGDAAR